MLLLMVVLGISGCGSNQAIDIATGEEEPQSAQQLISLGDKERAARRYDTAALLYGLVEQWFPLDEQAPDAQLIAAYCFYQDRDYNNTIATLDRYIFLHPVNHKTEYAYYLKAITYYDQVPDIFRDQWVTQETLTAFDDFLERYPNSRYGDDVRKKRREIRGQLAAQNMVVGRYYLQSGNYLAAYNRFRMISLDFTDTNQAPEAYFRLIETTLALSLRTEALEHYQVLQNEYGDNEWTARANKLVGI